MKLGRNQYGFLRAVKQYGYFYPCCGWIWQNHSTSRRLAQSLVRKGLLVGEQRQRRNWTYTAFTLTPAGEQYLRQEERPV